jgi:hypothetical protein
MKTTIVGLLSLFAFAFASGGANAQTITSWRCSGNPLVYSAYGDCEAQQSSGNYIVPLPHM